MNNLLSKYYSDGTFPVDINLILARNLIELRFAKIKEENLVAYIDNDSKNKYINFVFNEKYEKEIFENNDIGHEFKFIASILLINFLKNNKTFKLYNKDLKLDIYYDLVGKLLIPTIFLEDLFNNKKLTNLSLFDFSKKFRVSISLANYRLKKLNLI